MGERCEGDLHSPPGKVKGLASLDEGLIEFVTPFADACIDERLHLLDVGEAVLHCELVPSLKSVG